MYYDVIVEHSNTGKKEILTVCPTVSGARKIAEIVSNQYPRVIVCDREGYLIEEYVGGRRTAHMG